MGDHLGFDLLALQQAATWLGVEIGEQELVWIEAVEEEWLERREAAKAWAKLHPGAEETD
jgi:hypothetical protein